MKTKSDPFIIVVAALTGTMLLMVFAGELIPAIARTIIYAVCIVGIVGVLVLKNLLPGARAAGLRKLFGVGFLIYGVILVSVILFDQSFVPGDSLRFGMEPATAMLVFGVTFSPFVLTFLWVVGFDRAIMTPEKEERLNQLTEEQKEDQSDG